MDLNTCKQFGINLNGYAGIKGDEEAVMAMDAALLTTANTTVPAELLAFFDPKAIEVLTAKRTATQIFNEVKKGDRTTPYAKFRMVEHTGYTQPYSDYSDNGKSDVNYSYPVRENYLFETVIKYGDLEEAESSRAKVNLLADLQSSAAHNIAIDTNRFYFSGVSGMDNYGILNQPNLPQAIVAANGAAGTATWATKTGTEIYNDIVALYSDMASRADGNITKDTSFKLIVGPTSDAELNKLNAFGTETVAALIKRNFRNLEIIVAPEYDDSTKKIQLIAVNVDGQATGECAYSEKFTAGRVVPFLSHFAQKFSAGVFGTVIYRPVFVSTMTGI
jgi:hypothetical protein